MLPPTNNCQGFDDFISTYEELHARFRHHDNARAFLNEVATEVLTSLGRKGRAGTDTHPRKYFLWLLARKGFNAKCYYWRDVDLPRHQCDYKTVVNVPLEGFNVASDARFGYDPREEIMNGIEFEQVMESLDTEDQRLFELRIVQGLTLREIAEQEAITPQGVKKRLDKVFGKVRKRLKTVGD